MVGVMFRIHILVVRHPRCGVVATQSRLVRHIWTMGWATIRRRVMMVVPRMIIVDGWKGPRGYPVRMIVRRGG